MKHKFISFLLVGALAFTTVSCGASGDSSQTTETTPQINTSAGTEETSATTDETLTTTEDSSTTESADQQALPEEDRAGNAIVIPETVDRIVSLAGSSTEILVDLGLGDKIVAIDTNSISFEGLDADLPAIDLMNPDIEALLAVDADLIFVSSISDAGGETSVLQQLIDEGVTVAYIPTSESFAEIMEDIRFIGAATSTSEKADVLIETFQNGLNDLAAIAATIPAEEKRTVFVEISALPYLYSTGTNTFLNEIIELVGAINVLADEESWVPVTEEAAIALNPDVILTNVNYLEDPVAEILGRGGWESVTAVALEDVYQIDNNRSSLPNHNVLEGAREIARAVYPEYFD